MNSTSTVKTRVAVIGAGIAGLTAAYHLGNSGFEVTVIETQSRPGGRAITIRDPFPFHLVAQAGPSRFPSSFNRVFQYARRYDLELRPFYPNRGRIVAYLRGKRIEDYQPTSEEFWSYSAIFGRYPSKVERFSLRFALLAFQKIRKILGKTPWMTYRILDGTDRITEKLATEINASFILGSKVISINQEKKRVRLGVSSSEAITSLDFDYVVCATPLSELNELQFTPQLPSKKKELATEIPFSSAVRVFLQMKDRYWRRYGYSGFAVTDTIGEIWDPNFDVPKTPAMLVCYAQDELADLLSELDETRLIEYVLLELEKVFPGARENFEYGVSFDWKKQAWIKGGWPHVRRFMHRIGEFRRPFDRVCFAGDYAAEPRFLNMMEGAIESGEYAANLIKKISKCTS